MATIFKKEKEPVLRVRKYARQEVVALKKSLPADWCCPFGGSLRNFLSPRLLLCKEIQEAPEKQSLSPQLPVLRISLHKSSPGKVTPPRLCVIAHKTQALHECHSWRAHKDLKDGKPIMCAMHTACLAPLFVDLKKQGASSPHPFEDSHPDSVHWNYNDGSLRLRSVCHKCPVAHKAVSKLVRLEMTHLEARPQRRTKRNRQITQQSLTHTYIYIYMCCGMLCRSQERQIAQKGPCHTYIYIYININIHIYIHDYVYTCLRFAYLYVLQ